MIASTNHETSQQLPHLPEEVYSEVGPIPDVPSGQKDLEAWCDVFRTRATWASSSLDTSSSIKNACIKHLDATRVIRRSLIVAIENLRLHVQTLVAKQDEAQRWAQQAIDEHRTVASNAQDTVSYFDALPVKLDVAGFFPALSKVKRNADGTSGAVGMKSKSIISHQDVDLATCALESSSAEIVARVKSLADQISQLAHDASGLLELATTAGDHVQVTEPQALLEDIKIVASKVCSDCDHVVQMSPDSASTIQASKMASNHSRNHLAALAEYRLEMEDILKKTLVKRREASISAVETMRQIAKLEATVAHANRQLHHLDLPPDFIDVFDFLVVVGQFPFLYGSLLIESVRRCEWTNRIKEESTTLVEDIAGCRDAEKRRRRRWLETLGHVVDQDLGSGICASFELNLHCEDSLWPHVTRADISKYLAALSAIGSLQEVHQELLNVVHDLDVPLQGTAMKPNLFNFGSLHETSTGRPNFFMERGSGEIHELRRSNARLEEDLKGQRSRVRRLEEMLYRQNQSGRSNPESQSQSQEGFPWDLSTLDSPSIPKTDNVALAKLPTSSRKSSTNPTNQMGLAQRLVKLEADVDAERQKYNTLEKELENKRDAADQAALESTLVKNDLLENLEAQRQEFMRERRSLEDEISGYKVRLEEFEDEFDRLLGSRDNYKTSAEEKLHSIDIELRQTEKTLFELRQEMTAREEVQQDELVLLANVYRILAQGAPAPSLCAELIDALEGLAQRSIQREKELQQSLYSAISDRDTAMLSNRRREDKLTTLEERIHTLESDKSATRDELDIEKARSSSLSSELDDGRTQLRNLRAKFAEGETGSETLRARVESQARRASELASELAEARTTVKSLAIEVSTGQRQHQQSQQKQQSLSSQLFQRSIRDKELTKRLVERNQQIANLVDSLGLTAHFRDGNLVVQRTSKLSNPAVSTVLPDMISTGILSTGNPTERGVLFQTSPSSAALQWMYADNAEEEEKSFAQLLTKVDDFRLDVVSEAIIKLRRDVEWTGKKWKTEARSYRDKYHKSKIETHEKVAFRSFKEGDLALFLPTRNQATRPWAAFNVGAPHYFLRELDSHKLKEREWLVARIGKISERMVDLSKTIDSLKGTDGRSIGEASDVSVDDNPFELSDGLRWYLVDAVEEKAGAPSTPGLGKSTVASANVDVKGSIRMKKSSAGADASTKLADASSKLNKSLESRRSSVASPKTGSISGTPPDFAVDSTSINATVTRGTNPERISNIDLTRALIQHPLRSPGSKLSINTASSQTSVGPRMVQRTGESNEEVSRRDQMLGP